MFYTFLTKHKGVQSRCLSSIFIVPHWIWFKLRCKVGLFLFQRLESSRICNAKHVKVAHEIINKITDEIQVCVQCCVFVFQSLSPRQMISLLSIRWRIIGSVKGTSLEKKHFLKSFLGSTKRLSFLQAWLVLNVAIPSTYLQCIKTLMTDLHCRLPTLEKFVTSRSSAKSSPQDPPYSLGIFRSLDIGSRLNHWHFCSMSWNAHPTCCTWLFMLR